MKQTILTVVIAAAIATISFTSCSSSEQKVENAENKVEDAKENLKEVIKDSSIAAQKAATAEEWKMFKNVAEVTIKNNEIRINNLRAKIKNGGVAADVVYAQKIENLKQQNNNLKAKIDKYEKNYTDWESFKNEFNHDVEGLGKAFKDLTIKNKN